jgi:hypothetical protein
LTFDVFVRLFAVKGNHVVVGNYQENRAQVLVLDPEHGRMTSLLRIRIAQESLQRPCFGFRFLQHTDMQHTDMQHTGMQGLCIAVPSMDSSCRCGGVWNVYTGDQVLSAEEAHRASCGAGAVAALLKVSLAKPQAGGQKIRLDSISRDDPVRYRMTLGDGNEDDDYVSLRVHCYGVPVHDAWRWKYPVLIPEVGVFVTGVPGVQATVGFKLCRLRKRLRPVKSSWTLACL